MKKDSSTSGFRDKDLRRLIPNVEGEILFETASSVIADGADVETELERRHWVTRIDGDGVAGIYSYQAPLSQLLRVLKQLVWKLASDLGYEEMVFPRHYRREVLQAFGWTENDQLRGELVVITPMEISPNRSNHELFGDPLQCPGFYETLRVISQRSGGLPHGLFSDGALRVYEDQGGWTLRNELTARLTGGFATGFEFSGAELVWAGRLNDSLTTRWETLCAVIDLLDSCELSYRLVVGGSCSRDAAQPDLRGKPMPLYEIPTIDIEAFVGDSSRTKSWIEIGGGDLAGTRITKRFGLLCEDGTELHSGCQGIGWQRLAYAILAQKGLSPKTWPEYLARAYGQTLPASRLVKDE